MAKGKNGKKATPGEIAAKRARTRDNKMRILAKHLELHPGDPVAEKALKRWQENPPNKV